MIPSPLLTSEALTGGIAHPTQLLYFTTSSVTADGSTLVVVREEQGQPNICALDLKTRVLRRLTDNRDGTLKSYVYFRGNSHRGLGKASICMDTVRRRVFFLQGDEIMRLDLDTGHSRSLARLPADQVTAFTHVSADGRRLCVPTTDARALEDESASEVTHGINAVGGKRNEIISDKPTYDIDERVRREGLSSWIRIYDTETGAATGCEQVRAGWITHVQFSPTHPNWILYNHEWASDSGIRRIWLWDGHSHRALRTEGDGRSRSDWACHEMWEADGAGVIYHGKYASGAAFIGRVDPVTSSVSEIEIPQRYHRYGHFTAGTVNKAWLVSDGYWHPEDQPENGLWGGEWITRLIVDWPNRTIEWTPLCQHHSAWDCQDSHPHPVFEPGDERVYFTSNHEGGRSVARIAVPKA